MPRPKPEAHPTQLTNQLGVMLDAEDVAMVKRVAARYGISKSAAGRLLIRAGAAQHDPNPSPPKENPS